MLPNAYVDQAIDLVIGHPMVSVALAFAAGLLSWFITRTGDRV